MHGCFALAGHTQAEAGDDEAVESFKQFARQSMIEILEWIQTVFVWTVGVYALSVIDHQ